MSISPVKQRMSCESIDSSVDSEGNLKDFIAPDSPKVKMKRLVRTSDRLSKRQKIDFSHLTLPKEDEEKLKSFEDRSKIPNKIGQVMHSALNLLTPDKVIGRREEARQILSMVMQPEAGVRPLLVGAAGIGKFSIVKLASQMLMNEMKDHPYGRKEIICLDCNQWLYECSEENSASDIGKAVQSVLDQALKRTGSMPILYFRQIEKMILIEKMATVFHKIFEKNHPFIASISEPPESEIVLKIESLLSRYNFSRLLIQEMPFAEVRQIVKSHLQRHKLHPQLSFDEETIELSLRLSQKYDHSRPFPAKAINMLQTCGNHVLMEKGDFPRTITSQDLAKAVSQRTKVPAEDLLDSVVFNQKLFEKRLKSRIVGQDHAIQIVSNQVAAYKMNLTDTKKPWGVFLFVGPTGVGKTELATCIAKYLFNDESKLITINGSEYVEDYTVSNLIGSPKGYEGNESGGLLTEPLKKDPHQVVLLDEFEKAHPHVQKLFLQIFDRGLVTDRKGDHINCAPTLFIMTSNIGSQILSELASKEDFNAESVNDILVPLLKSHFSPELVGRFKRGIVPFRSLNRQFMPKVAEVKLTAIKDRLEKQAEIELSWSPELIDHFSEADVDLGLGMREFSNMIDESVTNIIKEAMLKSKKRLTGKLEFSYLKEKGAISLKVKNGR